MICLVKLQQQQSGRPSKFTTSLSLPTCISMQISACFMVIGQHMIHRCKQKGGAAALPRQWRWRRWVVVPAAAQQNLPWCCSPARHNPECMLLLCKASAAAGIECIHVPLSLPTCTLITSTVCFISRSQLKVQRGFCTGAATQGCTNCTNKATMICGLGHQIFSLALFSMMGDAPHVLIQLYKRPGEAPDKACKGGEQASAGLRSMLSWAVPSHQDASCSKAARNCCLILHSTSSLVLGSIQCSGHGIRYTGKRGGGHPRAM